MDELKSLGKPFSISKRAVWEAYEKVKANKGAPGVDGVLDRGVREGSAGTTCTRSGTGCPRGATSRPRCVRWRYRSRTAAARGSWACLPWPTGSRRRWSPGSWGRRVEPIFHPDSYGYRPGRSALDAVGACRERCWKTDWVIDLDIRKFFDSVPWDLIVKAVEANTDLPWVVLYVQRWLQAPLQLPDGTLQQRDRGTPQGSAVSPVLANLFLHYAFDAWMAREFPAVSFERYVDDAVVHCVS